VHLTVIHFMGHASHKRQHCSRELRRWFSGPVTSLTPAAFGMSLARAPSRQADPPPGYKAVVPRRLSINSLHPFLLPLHFSDVSCLRPLASSILPPGSFPAGRRPHRKIRRSQLEEYLHTRLLAIICSRSQQHFLVNYLVMGLPSVMTKDHADDVT
jgi:hypothetical protein